MEKYELSQRVYDTAARRWMSGQSGVPCEFISVGMFRDGFIKYPK